MTQEAVDELLKRTKYVFAKSMPSMPHEYSHRLNWKNDKDFCDVVQWIRDNGVKERFGSKVYVYYYLNGYKYWTMGNELSYVDKTKTFILNRAKA